MTFDPREIIVGILLCGAFIAVPALSILAFQEWRRDIRSDLPRWRNVGGGTAVCLTILGWLLYGFLLFASRAQFWHHDISGGFGAVGILALGGASLAFAWRGKARFRAVTAGCLLTTIWASFLLMPQ